MFPIPPIVFSLISVEPHLGHLPETIERVLKDMDAKEQMLLLNLLGGRLPLGHRLVGMDVDMLKRKSMDDLNRVIRRIEKVGETLTKFNI